ncbi:T9SS type A sorting domain-containing protein [Fibrella sp. HMF5335]|uniref:T9SS type A sorting domain-containing protein n=1 Tax=Fibrella rubiginis TaxID=2817060 RepID=A0A939K3Q3_9BACT|nr:choice-of-anchor Q domain-containing protein [Fibrella rubiginis]MBO0939502.1 T9SS type A sorting domain-containing protein [Fibrella rubiginis]
MRPLRYLLRWLAPALFLLLTSPVVLAGPTPAPPAPHSPLRQHIIDKLRTQPTLNVELFVMSQCPFGVQAETALIPLLDEFGSRLHFQLYYIVAPAAPSSLQPYRSLHGPTEVAENVRQLVIADRFPARWLAYLAARATNYQTDDWQQAARQVGLDVAEVTQLTQQETAQDRLARHSQQTQARQVRSSPSLFLDGERYDGNLLPPTNRQLTQTGLACTTDANCDDSNACTTDQCTNGQCVNTPRTCDDNNRCTTDYCDRAAGGCVYVPKNCDDNNPGTLDACAPASGGCINTPITRVHVNQAVGSSGDGSTWGQAFKTLTEGLAAANTYASITEIWVAAGTYKPTTTTGPDSRTISFSMKNGVAIYGGFVGNETALSQRPAINPVLGNPSSSTLSGDIGTAGNNTDNSYHVISNPAGLTNTALLDGFVVTGGNANGGGNTNGGGVYNDDGYRSVCSPSFQNCSLIGNTALSGGAMFNNGFSGVSSPVLTNCVLQSNTATSEGGAMFNDGFFGVSSPVLINCSLQDNTARLCGAMLNNGTWGVSSPVLTNCAFQANSATQRGGALYNVGTDGQSYPVLTNCSLQSNTAPTGGAMYNVASGGQSRPVLTNCILWNNGGGNTVFNDNAVGASATYSLFDNATNVNISGPGNLTTATSPFASTATVALAVVSPAINAGNPASQTAATGPYSAAALPATDLAGNPRIAQGRVDMGAVEYQCTFPTRLYVAASQTTPDGDGLTWATAFKDLQNALTYPCSQSLTEIWVAAGTYKPTTTTGPDSRTISFSMKNGVAIYGGFVGNETALSQRPAINPVSGNPSSSTLSGDIGTAGNNTDNSYHVINNSNSGLTSTAVLDGFVITGGAATSRIIPGVNGVGGSNSGGGLLLNNAGSPVVTNCLFTANNAENGGGIYTYASSPSINNCSFLTNAASLFGGVIFNLGNLTLTNCSFQGNSTSRHGGAIFNQSNTILTLTNCSFLSNIASSDGGAIFNQSSSSPALTNCSFQSNSASSNGGAIYNTSSIGTPTGPTLTNCMLWGNGGSNTIFNNNNSTLTASYSLFDNTVTGYTGSNNLTTSTSPFASTATVALAVGSPAINAGNPASQTVATGPYSATALPATDLAGNPRIVRGQVDMGAVEYQGPFSLTLLTSAAPNPVCAGSSVGLSVTASGGVSPYSYTWVAPAGITLSGTSTSAVSASAGAGVSGVQTLTITVADALSPMPIVSTSLVSVTVNTPPAATLSPASVSVCSPNNVTLTAAAGGTTYAFSGPGLSQSGSSNTAFVSRSGTYTVVVTGSNGCTATGTSSVTINPLPSAPTLAPGASFTTLVNNTPFNLTSLVVAATPPNTLTFRGALGLVSPPLADISTVGVQTFSAIQTSPQGCASPAVVFSLTVLSPLPPTSQTLCRGSQVVMNVFPTGTRYEWYKNGQTAANKLLDVVGVQRGTATASLTLVSAQTNASFYCKVFAADGSFTWSGPFAVVLGNCGGRVGRAEDTPPLTIILTPNPLEDNQLQATITGAEGQALTVQLVDMQGRTVRQQAWQHTAQKQSVVWMVSDLTTGVYLLQATTSKQSQRARVLKP